MNKQVSGTKDWMNKKFLEWQMKSGSHQTISDFAEFLGFKQGTVSFWLNGNRTPSYENALQICSKLHDYSLFDVMSIDSIHLPVGNLPDPLRNRLTLALREVNATLSGADLSQDEAMQITREILARFGVTVNTTT